MDNIKKQLLVLSLAAVSAVSGALMLTGCGSAAPVESLTMAAPTESVSSAAVDENQAEQARNRILTGLQEIDSRESFDILHTVSSSRGIKDFTRFLKDGEDRMCVTYVQSEGQPVPLNASMVRNGISYLLTHEDMNTNDSPIWGWEPKLNLPEGRSQFHWQPILDDLDQVRFTEVTENKIIAHMELPSPVKDMPDIRKDIGFTFDEAGTLTAIRIATTEYQWNSHEEREELKTCWDVEILADDQVSQIFADQKEAPVRPFSWEEDQKNMKADHVTFQNTEKQDVADAVQALNRAKAEITEEFDGTVVYYDPDAQIWKVEFQKGCGWQGYRYVYLDWDGMTQMIAAAGPKEQWYPES